MKNVNQKPPVQKASNFTSMKKALLLAMVLITTQAFSQQRISLPITWQDSTSINYTTTAFGGALSKLAPDPTNPSRTALRIVKPDPSEVWAGVTLGTPDGFANPMPFTSSNQIVKVQVYAPNTGMVIKLKAEDRADATKFVETDVTTTVANAWDTLTFNFGNPAPGTPAINLANNHHKLSIFPNFGVNGTTAGTKVFFVGFVSNVMGAGGPQLQRISLPITWQDGANVDYTTTPFGGCSSEVTADPANPNLKALRIIKTAGAETWGGVTFGTPNGFATNIPFAASANQMQVRVYSPDAGVVFRMKAEDRSNAAISVETDAPVTTANGWQTLTFNFANHATGTAPINYANSYNKLSIFPNFGVSGATAGEKTYFVGEVAFGTVSSIKGLNNLGQAVIAPNPNNGQFSISLPSLVGELATIEVTDIAGRVVYAETGNINAEAKSINLSNLQNGVYFCRVTSGSSYTNQKLVIRN